MPKKRNLLQFLQEEYFRTIEEASEAVKLGVVTLNGKTIKRPGIDFSEETDKIKVVGKGKLYVSRGGYKLLEALESFEVDVKNRICLDIGSSTGGFTDCLLQRGAQLVYAIDTGYGQLAWKLRTDPKVKCLERTNVRYLLPETLYAFSEAPQASLAVIDVSFISVITLIPSIQRLLNREKGELVILMKPQFEAGKNDVARGGLIRNPNVHIAVLTSFIEGAYRAGLEIRKIKHSPILGASGNLEFLLHGFLPTAGVKQHPNLPDWVEKVVGFAYAEFGLQ